MSPQAPPRYALIVGVDDYSGFDQSAGQAPGSSDLRGAIADAMAFVHIAGRAGVPTGHTRVLLGARPDAAPMLPGGITAGRADRESVLDGLRWLAEGLASADDAVGLLCFAGHGATSDDDLLLCPGDVDAELHNAVAYREIEEILGEAAQRGALTVILDAAHGPKLRDPAARARSLRRGPLAEALVDRALALDAAIVCASAPGAYGMEARFEQSHRGVLSHALELLMGSFATGDAAVPFQISTEDLVSRVGRMAGALGVPQAPVALGSERRLKDAALAPRGTAVPREGGLAMLFGSELLPDGSEAGFAAYSLSVQNRNNGTVGDVIASQGLLIVTGGQFSTTYDFSAARAYWYWPKLQSQASVNPFGIASTQSFVLHYNASISLKNVSASEFSTCFADNDFAVNTNAQNNGSAQLAFSSLTTSSDKWFKINFSGNTQVVGYLFVTNTGNGATPGAATDDTQTWVKLYLDSSTAPANPLTPNNTAVLNSAKTLNTDAGRAVIFTPIASLPSDNSLNGWHVTDSRPT